MLQDKKRTALAYPEEADGQHHGRTALVTGAARGLGLAIASC